MFASHSVFWGTSWSRTL